MKNPATSPVALSLLIPTYNEAEIILPALATIADTLKDECCRATEVLIVDDGTDTLPELVRDKGQGYGFASVEVLRNEIPLGKGRSLAMGFERARGQVVGFLDVDLSTSPRYIPQAKAAVESGKCDIFIASRWIEGAQVTREQSVVKDVLGDLLGVIARGIIFQGMRNFKDTQCGFKFYRNEVAKLLYRDLAAPDGLNDLEVLIRANLLGYRVHEQGVEWKDIRESKRPLSRILWGELVAIARILYLYRLNKGRALEGLRCAAGKLRDNV